MLFHLGVGIVAAVTFMMLLNYVKKSARTITWWQWALTALGIIYAIFVLEVIYGFAAEGEPQAAVVMGLITGVIAVIWGVLLGRFVFAKKTDQSLS